MVRSLAGQIEQYLKELLLSQSFIELQRSQLADIFSCVPSQINYVLSTRFTPAQGYIVESRRGGGGYLKIVKLDWNKLPEIEVTALPALRQQEGLSQGEAEGILERLWEEDLITAREQQLLRAIMDRQVLKGSAAEQAELRARLLSAAISALFRQDI
ncbi:MAG: CtsR family transcriptional regulator [Peptococcaceae bacterium]|nr:CtsR family transcriptional regulator [Peptococcaceae bacterium]